MRAAGCVINDIADRNFDLHVTRTKSRVLTSGKVSLIEAFLLFFILTLLALIILLKLPSVCFYYALFAVFITILYPFCKRFINSPQTILGLAFSMGIPMAFAATSKQFDYQAMGLLFLINFLWIVCYDTEYAMIDRQEDLQIGIQSTAILFGKYDRFIIALLQISFHGLWLLFLLKHNVMENTFLTSKLLFSFCWLLASLVLIYQQMLMAQQQTQKYFQAFNTNVWYGLIMWLPFIHFKS